MPGFTHLQKAQPTTLAHHFGAYFEMFLRDYDRLVSTRKRMNLSPLGSGAFAGTTYELDRDYVADLLDFDTATRNSMDSVSDRDYLLELLSDLSIISMHLSRLSEEIIIWNTDEYRFVEMDDTYSTGSSIMPQKKNPDVPELVRGKTGRVYGHLVALLTLMKSQPLAYNKDNQEDKEPLFDTIDTVLACLRAFADMIPAIEANREAMYRAAGAGYSTATDLADYLVRRGVAFRDAHEIVGRAVHLAIERHTTLDALPLADLQTLSPAIAADVYESLTLEGSVNARDHFGGTAPAQVKARIKQAQEKLQD